MNDRSDTVGDPAQILREARVVSVDRAAATCVVAIGDPDGEDGEVESAAIPWLAARSGETVVWSPPSEGEAGMLLCPGGDLAQGLFVAGLYSTQFPAPGNGTREFIRFADDAEFGYDPDAGAADLTLPAGASYYYAYLVDGADWCSDSPGDQLAVGLCPPPIKLIPIEIVGVQRSVSHT